LYQAAFNRVPDLGGLGFWIRALDAGVSLVSVARDFLTSAEFVKTYGSNLSDEQFVDLMYHNILHREPDAGGAAFYLNALHAGGPRASVLSSISESIENQIGVVGSITNGIEYHIAIG